jgi:GNAT superfamily N-acetyltransferase
MTIKTRLATAADLPALAALFHEMQVHYEGSAAISEATARAALARHVFGGDGRIDALVAEADGWLLGFAFVSTLFPAHAGTSALFMKDIFVTASARSRGVGRTLMCAVAHLAARRGCSQVSWNAERNNAAARAFYAGLGARQRNDMVILRLDGAALARLAADAG